MTALPPDLQVAIRSALDTVAFSRLQQIVDVMLPAYRNGHSGPPTIGSEEMALAYAAYRLPGTFAALRRVLAEAISTIRSFTPESMIDVGGGSGAAAWAATDTLPTLHRIRILDRSRAALDLGRQLAATGPDPIAQAEWEEHHTSTPLPPADLAVAAYLLGELPAADRPGLVKHLTVAAPTVAVVEPGTPAGYRRIIEARSLLIESGLAIAAPCPHEAVCPLLDDNWCHFSVRFERSPELRRLKRAEHGYEDEKFSYVVATRLSIQRPLSRVVRHPQYRGKMVMLELCQADGTAGPTVVTKSRREAYRRARKVEWGDGWDET